MNYDSVVVTSNAVCQCLQGLCVAAAHKGMKELAAVGLSTQREKGLDLLPGIYVCAYAEEHKPTPKTGETVLELELILLATLRKLCRPGHWTQALALLL